MDVRDRILMVLEAKPELNPTNVSLKAGMSNSALTKFLKGDTNDLKIETANKIADALGVDRAWLTHGVGDMDQATPIDDRLRDLSDDQRNQLMRFVETFLPRTGTDN